MHFGLNGALIVLLLVPESKCLPTDASNLPQGDRDAHIGFVADPDGRGTLSLLLSCTLTLVLCVWSALHLNVPPQGVTRRQKFWTNVRWITAGIYAPELVVFAAWRQWSSAKLLSAAVRTMEKDRKRSTSLHNAWTMTHSFFACTGGFAFDCKPYITSSENKDGFLPATAPHRLTITARGMAFLAQCGFVPDIPQEDIQDKSKADGLSKALVLLQATWMLVQVLGRLISHLPVTPIEVNTAAHVLCALAMYFMWWHKPFMPNEPVLVHGPWVPQLLAFMFMTSEVSGVVDEKNVKSKTIVKTLFAWLRLYSKTPEVEFVCTRQQAQPPQSGINPGTPESGPSPTGLRRGLTWRQHEASCQKLLKEEAHKKEAGTAFFERRPRVQADPLRIQTSDGAVQRRRELFLEAISQYDATNEFQQFSHDVPGAGRCEHYAAAQLVALFSRNWPSDELLRDVGGLVVGMVLWLANFIYGGIHAAAWNDSFPSKTERWLWRGSASYIGFCGGLWVVLNFAVSRYRPLNEFWERWMDGDKSWFHNIFLGTLVFVCGFSLMLARAYIVIEAFISIRSLPPTAYQTPNWSQLIPHF